MEYRKPKVIQPYNRGCVQGRTVACVRGARRGPHPYDPAKARQLLTEAGYPNGFDAGELHPWPPYFSMGEAIGGYLGAVGIKVKLRTMERAAFYSARRNEKRA